MWKQKYLEQVYFSSHAVTKTGSVWELCHCSSVREMPHSVWMLDTYKSYWSGRAVKHHHQQGGRSIAQTSSRASLCLGSMEDRKKGWLVNSGEDQLAGITRSLNSISIPIMPGQRTFGWYPVSATSYLFSPHWRGKCALEAHSLLTRWEEILCKHTMSLALLQVASCPGDPTELHSSKVLSVRPGG